MSLRSLLAIKININFKKYWLPAVLIFFIFWVALSFYIPYYRITFYHFSWFFKEFTDYLIYFQVVSTLLFAYLVAGGRLSEIKNHLKKVIVFTSILVVFAFTFFQWIDVTTDYGQYGYPDVALYHNDKVYSDFERETLYREEWVYNYNLTIQQIAIFGGFVFASTFLILMALGKKKESDK